MSNQMKTCYGVSRNDRNELVANQFAANVQKIYALYLSSRSLRNICKDLQILRIYSPSDKSEWTPRAISAEKKSKLLHKQDHWLAHYSLSGEAQAKEILFEKHARLLKRELYF